MELAKLQSIFQACDVGWVFQEAAEERGQQILREMLDVDEWFAQAFSRPLEPPLEQAISGDTIRFKPLVQSFASPMTAPIRTMIFCVLGGAQVKAVQFDYDYCKRSVLRVSVELNSGEIATFESNEIWDFEALRHFGLMKMGNNPVIDGYYAFAK